MKFEKFDLNSYSSDWKMDILKQVSDSPGNSRKMTLRSNFKTKFSERPLDVLRGFFLHFGVILDAWLARVILQLKIGRPKRWNVPFSGQGRKNDVTQQLQTKVA